MRLVIEVDGNQHAEQVERDAERDDWLRGQGFMVLRFSNREVLTSIESVEEAIWIALTEPPPQPSPARGEGVRGEASA